MAAAARTLGDRSVGPIALGTASWSIHAEPLDADRAAELIAAALERGVTLVDTAHVYTTRDREAYSEKLVGEALRRLGHPDELLVATKGGHFRDGDSFPIDGRPEAIRRHCERSLQALGVERIELYQLHWPDPAVPIAESMGAFAELRDEGKIRLVGVSNVTVEQLDAARSVVEVASVQNQLPLDRPDPVLERCEELGLAYLAYAPFGGTGGAASLGAPFPELAAIAAERGVSPQRVALAWLLARSPAVVPIVGCRRPETLADSAAAAELELTADELERLGPG